MMTPYRMLSLVRGLCVTALGFAVLALAPGQSRAANLTALVSFCAQPNCADGRLPVAGLIADANGNLFGTTERGGTNDFGTVFEIAKTASGFASTPTILYSFCSVFMNGFCTDGREPVAGLIADTSGNLFGTTQSGGANNAGTVFEIAKTASGFASTPAILYSFCAQPNCADGRLPVAGLIADANGNLFGTTQLGGANNAGTVFELAKTASGFASNPAILYSFCSRTDNLGRCLDGLEPVAGLIADANGNLFGTTSGGGTDESGTVFEIAKTASGFASAATRLYSFCAQPGCADGDQPVAGLIADANGNLFGTTQSGGAHNNGTVFEIAKTASGFASTPTILYSFCSVFINGFCTDGSDPVAGLIADANGNLFGTTQLDGVNGGGVVFEIAVFAGTPGKANCVGASVARLAQKYHGLNAASAALGYPSVAALQQAIVSFCQA